MKSRVAGGPIDRPRPQRDEDEVKHKIVGSGNKIVGISRQEAKELGTMVVNSVHERQIIKGLQL
jgi:hypothetical protein